MTGACMSLRTRPGGRKSVGPADIDGSLAEVQPGDLVLFRSDNAENWGNEASWRCRRGRPVVGLTVTRPDRVSTFGRAFESSDV
jgi:hypothetical protein